jgi:FlaA1/EpsC-like NDP-sugar epimerase
MKSKFTFILSPNRFMRMMFFLLSDAILISISLVLSFALRFEFLIPPNYKKILFSVLPFFIIVKIIFFAAFRLYKITWRYVGLNDLSTIVFALLIAQLTIVAIAYVPLPEFTQSLTIRFAGFPRSILVIDFFTTLLLISTLRIAKRVVLEVVREGARPREGMLTLIIGAGNTGEMVLRDIIKQRHSQYSPIGLLDDNLTKTDTYIHGIKVLGPSRHLADYVKKYNIQAIIIAIPSLSYPVLRGFFNTARDCGVQTVKIVPRIYDFHKPEINIKRLEDIKIEDLIGRQVVNIDYAEIERFLEGKRILITGAGGSIGSEIVMQLCAFRPKEVILFDVDETDLHAMDIKLGKLFPDLKENFHCITGDIRDTRRLNEVFGRFCPQIVFHAAAYKHVPMMELNPQEAIKVNIFGTENLVKASVEYGVEKFIMISTDKAVMPTSVMGATKRMAEYVCTAYNNNGTEFLSVRFGNVLGSRGSVLPLFMEQLKSGGPLTVTHSEMKRYFMTIPEAVSLVLQASTIGRGGEVLVLDMGEPIKIISLAEDLIRIHGFEPHRDIEIVITGMRPGEKLFEEILTAEEGTVATKHEKIFIAKDANGFTWNEVNGMLKELKMLLENSPGNDTDIRKFLKKHIKHYSESVEMS